MHEVEIPYEDRESFDKIVSTEAAKGDTFVYLLGNPCRETRQSPVCDATSHETNSVPDRERTELVSRLPLHVSLRVRVRLGSPLG